MTKHVATGLIFSHSKEVVMSVLSLMLMTLTKKYFKLYLT